ncbi:MAG: hypothetical protein EZS28_034685 [Streblomastix strix]|uniref:Uncharacterized protein n=1 Tax=Streblomastix strix TaxID=222440 RepID=A0A5J4UH95_9EUKA|nr:MAG: hypothetical protein EZS28_034685 [Streblomastix strix]
MKKRQIKSGDAAIYREEIKEADTNRFSDIINSNQRIKQQYYTLDIDEDIKHVERIVAEQHQRAKQRYRIQRQNFRIQAIDLQLLLIGRLQKIVINIKQDLLQINDIIERYNTMQAIEFD